jgi:hypothetical protein
MTFYWVEKKQWASTGCMYKRVRNRWQKSSCIPLEFGVIVYLNKISIVHLVCGVVRCSFVHKNSNIRQPPSPKRPNVNRIQPKQTSHMYTSASWNYFPAAASAALFCCSAWLSANLNPTLWVILIYLSAQCSTQFVSYLSRLLERKDVTHGVKHVWTRLL